MVLETWIISFSGSGMLLEELLLKYKKHRKNIVIYFQCFPQILGRTILNEVDQMSCSK